MRAPVEADPRVEDQRPHVGDEEVLWLVFLHIFELELWEFLFIQKRETRRGKISIITDKELQFPQHSFNFTFFQLLLTLWCCFLNLFLTDTRTLALKPREPEPS